MPGPSNYLDDETPPTGPTPRRRRSIVDALADLVAGKNGTNDPFAIGEADLRGSGPERPRAALPSLEPEAMARASAPPPTMRRAPEQPMAPRFPRASDVAPPPADATRVGGAMRMGRAGPATIAEGEQRDLRRRSTIRDVAEENFSPDKLREVAAKQRAVADRHRALGQTAEADEQERQAANAEALATAAERADTPGSIMLSNAVGLIHDPYAGERRAMNEAREPGMIADERTQRNLNIDRPTAPNRGEDVAKDYLYPMAGQIAPLIIGGGAGRAAVGAAGEALEGVQGLRGARTIGQALSRSARYLEPAVAEGPAIPLRVNAGARLAEELAQFQRAAPTLMARGASEGQIIGGMQSYRMAREQGATPEQAFTGAVDGMAISVPLGMAAELGFGAAGAVGRMGREAFGSAARVVHDAAEAAGDMARARPTEQSDAVRQLTTMQRIAPAVEMMDRRQAVRQMVEDERATSATRTMPVAEALGQVPEIARTEDHPAQPVAKEYQTAVNKYIDAMVAAETATTDEQRPGTKLQIALARARSALDDARRQYGQTTGVAAISALAANSDDLTDDEKKMVGLAGVSLAVPSVRAGILAIPAEVRTSITDLLTRSESEGGFAGFIASPKVWMEKLRTVVPDEHLGDINAALVNRRTAQGGGGLGTADVLHALSATEATRAPLRSRLIETIDALKGPAWEKERPAADWIGKLKGANTLAKTELGLLMPHLEAAAVGKQKLTRADVMEMARQVVPNVEQVTLAKTETKKGAVPETVSDGDPNSIHDFDDIESAVTQGLHPDGLDLPTYVQEQIDNRAARIDEITSEVDQRVDMARHEISEAEENYGRAQREHHSTLADLGVSNTSIQDAFQYMDEQIEGDYIPRGTVDKAFDKIMDDVNVSLSDDEERDLLKDHGYTVTREVQKFANRDWIIRNSEGHKMGTVDHRFNTPEEAQDYLKRRYGTDSRYTIKRPSRKEWKESVGDNEPEWVVRANNGVETTRDSNENLAIQAAISDNGLDSDLRDEKLGEARQAIEAYAEAYQQYRYVDSENYYIANHDEYNSEAFSSEFEERDKLTEEASKLGDLMQTAQRAAQQPGLVARGMNAVRGLLGGGEPDKGVMANGEPAPPENPYLMPLKPTVSGDPKYATYQRIGGGTNYRELINVWTNNPGDPYESGHFSRSGAISANDIGHIRAEDHTVPTSPVFRSKDLELPKNASEATHAGALEVLNLRKARDEKIRLMESYVRSHEALPAGEKEGEEAQRLARAYSAQNNQVIELSEREQAALNRLHDHVKDDEGVALESMDRGIDTENVAVMVESQSDWGQAAHGYGVKKSKPEREALQAQYRALSERAAAVDRERQMMPAYQRGSEEEVRARALDAEVDALQAQMIALQDAETGGVPPSPFLGDKGEGQAAYRLNAARFLIDSAERGYGRLAWSDAGNRMKNAHLPMTAAVNVYDKYTPAAIKSLLNGLGFKDVPIEKLYIKGEGHWSIEFPPAMREAIRRYGLPTLGLMALTGKNAEAQDSGSSKQNGTNGGVGLGTVIGATVAASAMAYVLGSRRARLLARTTPEVKALLETAVATVEKYKRNHPDFAFPRREPLGVEYTAPLDVAETPTGDGPAQFNVAKIGLSAEGETVWRKVVGDLGLKKRYVSWDETNKAAAERVPTIDDLLQEKPWSGTDALAARMFQSQASERLATLAADLPNKTADEKLLVRAEMDRVATDIADMATRAAGEREAAGRTLNAYKIIARSNMDEATWQTLAQRAKGDVPLTGDEILKVRGLISRSDREQLTQFVSSLHTSSAVDKWLTLWKAGLLTAIPTHVVNILSNAAEATTIAASQPAAVAIDALTALVRGTERERTLSGAVMARIRGAAEGVREGAQIMRSGASDAELWKWDTKRTNYDSPIFQAYTDVIFRSLGAADRPFYHAARHAALDELTTLAAQQAAKFDPSLKFDEVKSALMEDPPNELAARVSEEAARAVFQNEGTLASVASGGMRALRGGGKGRAMARVAAETILPFTRTPSNVASRFVDTTPLGLVTAVNRQLGGPFNQRQFSGDVARALTGTGGLMLLGYWLAENGHATGSAPTDAGDREVWKSQGKQANSVRLGDRWYNVARLGPPGMTIAAGAAYHDLVKAHPDNALAIAGGMAGTVGKITADQSFLLGLSRGIETITDPMKRGESMTSGLAASVVPAGVARAAQATDTLAREANTAGERIRSRIPGQSQKLRPQLNVFGDVMKRTGTDRAAALADPFFSSRAQDQPVLGEVERLGVGIAPLVRSRKLSDPTTGERFDVQYTDAERHDALASQIGPRRRDFLERLMTSASYAGMPDQARAKAIRKALDDADDEFYGRDDAARVRARTQRSSLSTPRP